MWPGTSPSWARRDPWCSRCAGTIRASIPGARSIQAYRGKFVSGFSAVATILRSEWGLKRGTPLVSDEIEIAIETELTRR